jgi:hypothetical protein
VESRVGHPFSSTNLSLNKRFELLSKFAVLTVAVEQEPTIKVRMKEIEEDIER